MASEFNGAAQEDFRFPGGTQTSVYVPPNLPPDQEYLKLHSFLGLLPFTIQTAAPSLPIQKKNCFLCAKEGKR